MCKKETSILWVETLAPNSDWHYVVLPCSLINPDGTLTSVGDTVVGCITNGAIVTVFESQFNIPLDTIKSILGGLAGPTGCSGIVNIDQIQTS